MRRVTVCSSIRAHRILPPLPPFKYVRARSFAFLIRFAVSSCLMVSGIVRGANLENSFQLMLVSSSGESAGRNVRLDPKSGEFQITGVPPGTFMLTAFSFKRRNNAQDSDSPPLRAMLPIQVNSDLTGV